MTLPDRLRRMSSQASKLFSQWDEDGRDNCGSLLIEAADAIERLNETRLHQVHAVADEAESVRGALANCRTVAREQWGKTTREFARACGVSPTQLSVWTAEPIEDRPDLF